MKKSNKYKFSEVISIVSHQLKTPLSVIKGYLEVLISEDFGKINAKQKEYLEDTLTNTQLMIKLVKEVLDVSRIEEDRMVFKPKPSNLEIIIKESIKEFTSLAEAKNCTISLKVLNQIPILDIDSLKVKEAVNNIISNAIDYSIGKGKVELCLKRKGNKVLFCCEDNGIGISEQDKKKIFTKFYRSEKSITITPQGSGLGLFISKAIIKKHNGEIWFSSKQGKGSTFCFSLPIKKL